MEELNGRSCNTLCIVHCQCFALPYIHHSHCVKSFLGVTAALGFVEFQFRGWWSLTCNWYLGFYTNILVGIQLNILPGIESFQELIRHHKSTGCISHIHSGNSPKTHLKRECPSKEQTSIVDECVFPSNTGESDFPSTNEASCLECNTTCCSEGYNTTKPMGLLRDEACQLGVERNILSFLAIQIRLPPLLTNLCWGLTFVTPEPRHRPPPLRTLTVHGWMHAGYE